MSDIAEDLKEGQTLVSPASTEAENTSGSSADEEELPFDQHPKWQSARAVEKKVEEILKNGNYADTEAVFKALANSEDLRKQVGDRDMAKLVEGAENWDKYQTWEREQKVERIFKERDEEDAEDKAVRYEQELRNLLSDKEQEDKLQLKKQQNMQLETNYNSNINNIIDSSENTSEIGKDLLRKVFTHGGLLTYGMDDEEAYKNSVMQVAKLLDEVGTDYVNRYRQGKLDVPTMTSTTETSVPTQKGVTRTKKDAIAILKAGIAKHGGKKDFWQ